MTSDIEHLYKIFLQNSICGQCYRIKLSDGRTLEGVPGSYSMAIPVFFINGLEIPLSDVVEVEKFSEDGDKVEDAKH